ncbi:MAG: hypothetical protein CBC13_08010 [Planctomycetia bacterium TMED53]|nr:MAG: hypothetical protein CBC13_08010 [Planctomycetia bacterium TMED53]
MAKKKRGKRQSKGDEALEEALISLDRSRGPLFLENRDDPKRNETRPAHCCERPVNKMRISELEAIDIARAFHEKPHLNGKADEVLERLGQAIHFLRDNRRPQAFDCPLLEDGQCMVHKVAKPIECLAYETVEDKISREGKRSIERRDQLNESLFGSEWDYRVIPFMLIRYLLDEEGAAIGSCGSTLRKSLQRNDRSAQER